MFYPKYFTPDRDGFTPTELLWLESHAVAAVLAADPEVLRNLPSIPGAVLYELENIGVVDEKHSDPVRRYLEANADGLERLLADAERGHRSIWQLFQPDFGLVAEHLGAAEAERWQGLWKNTTLRGAQPTAAAR